MNDEEILKSIVDAHGICGFPCSLLLAEPLALIALCHRYDIAPAWLRAVVACHILKHSRRGEGLIYVAYDGRHAELPFDESNHGTDLNSSENEDVQSSICRVLGLNVKVGSGRNPPIVPQLVRSVFNYMHLSTITQVRRMPLYFGLNRAVRYEAFHWKITGSQSGIRAPWINPGLRISKFARLNIQTGKIEHDAEAIGIEVVAYQWPRGMFNYFHHETWVATLPSEVEAMLPSVFEQKYAPNIEDLGHQTGYAALRNAKAFIDLHREDLYGTKMGAGLRVEFPIDMTIPFGSKRENTTNQNKTGLLRIRAGAIIPNIQTRLYVTTTGIPGARQFGDPIRFDGSIILDEVNKLPPNGEWFLDQSGIQGSATGSLSLPGGVAEKSSREYFELRMGLSMTSKSPWIFPMDVLNRSQITVLGDITPERTLSGDDLNDITTGKAALLLRFSMIRYSVMHGILEKLRGLMHPERGSGSRFPWHLAACRLFTPDGQLGDVAAYTKSVLQLIESNKIGAKESGLSDDLGLIDKSWDVVTAFKDCSDVDLEGALTPPAPEGDRRPVYGWRAREFVEFLRSRTNGPIHINNQKTSSKLMEAIRSGYMVRDDGIRLEIVVDKGRKIDVIKIITKSDHPTHPTNRLQSIETHQTENEIQPTPGRTITLSDNSLFESWDQIKAIAEQVACAEVNRQQLDHKAAVLAKDHLVNVVRNTIHTHCHSPVSAQHSVSDLLLKRTYDLLREWEHHSIDEAAFETVSLLVRSRDKHEAMSITHEAVMRVLRTVVNTAVHSNNVQNAIAEELADYAQSYIQAMMNDDKVDEARESYDLWMKIIPCIANREVLCKSTRYSSLMIGTNHGLVTSKAGCGCPNCGNPCFDFCDDKCRNEFAKYLEEENIESQECTP